MTRLRERLVAATNLELYGQKVRIFGRRSLFGRVYLMSKLTGSIGQ